MGDIGARQVRYEVLPTAAPPARAESRVETELRLEPAPQDRERRTARAEPARS